MNCDGGLSTLGDKGAAAVVCRDKSGTYLGASAVVFEGLVDPASLEAKACSEALALTTDLHVQSICVATDCLEVVTRIKDDLPCKFFPILQDIKYQRIAFRAVEFIHESRKHNGEAHALAKAAASLPPGRHVWLPSLPDIICIPISLNV